MQGPQSQGASATALGRSSPGMQEVCQGDWQRLQHRVMPVHGRLHDWQLTGAHVSTEAAGALEQGSEGALPLGASAQQGHRHGEQCG